MTAPPEKSDGSAPGLVSLVGAGPGDPGLITVRGLERLQCADAVVHDEMISPELLARARADAALIPAGKRRGHHCMEQDAINALLAELARAGKRVCRLKTGDPFVFGRGGEEALFLAAAGIPFEVVPGVTAAVGVPGAAGIPVTHRGLAAVCTVVTGHGDPDGEGRVDWEAVARAGGTVVVLMGLKHLAKIAGRLRRGGLAGETPAAVITRGTLPGERVVTGTLADIAACAEAAGAAPPGILVVGDVVTLRGGKTPG
ncbi:MAG TPA: uroporphyrinogen-III C-methyltransferase [Candidatus Hydrogenedentes bacterium]|nr:uroporphyrinogen-III C-methyltransferase [Candidatus Hydrogenedentota bacterium]